MKQHSKNVKTVGILPLLFCLCLLLFGCEDEDNEPKKTPVRTVLFYLGGDNNLSGEAAAKLEKLRLAAIPPDCRLLVYTDTRSSSPQLLEITTVKRENRVVVIREYEESSSASAETFGNILREMTERYPSFSYGLVLFSHASGWLPESTYGNPALRSVIDQCSKLSPSITCQQLATLVLADQDLIVSCKRILG